MYNEKESNKRMNIIGRNGNEGLHYSLNQENKMNLEVENLEKELFADLQKDLHLEREYLITDYIMIAGYSEADATNAAISVEQWDNMNLF